MSLLTDSFGNGRMESTREGGNVRAEEGSLSWTSAGRISDSSRMFPITPIAEAEHTDSAVILKRSYPLFLPLFSTLLTGEFKSLLYSSSLVGNEEVETSVQVTQKRGPPPLCFDCPAGIVKEVSPVVSGV